MAFCRASAHTSARHVPVFYRNGLTYCHIFFNGIAQSFYPTAGTQTFSKRFYNVYDCV